MASILDPISLVVRINKAMEPLAKAPKAAPRHKNSMNYTRDRNWASGQGNPDDAASCEALDGVSYG